MISHKLEELQQNCDYDCMYCNQLLMEYCSEKSDKTRRLYEKLNKWCENNSMALSKFFTEEGERDITLYRLDSNNPRKQKLRTIKDNKEIIEFLDMMEVNKD